MFRNKERGAALIEFVLVVPLLLMLIFAIIEFSVLLYDKAVITNASREVAREYAIYRQIPVTKVDLDKVVFEYAQKRMISFAGGAPPTLLIDPSNPVDKDIGQKYVTTEVTYIYDWFLLPAFMNNALPDIPLTATTVMRNEGYEPPSPAP